MIGRDTWRPPFPKSGRGLLYVASELPLAVASLRRVLRDAGLDWREPESGVLAVPVDEGTLRTLADAVGAAVCRMFMLAAPAVVVEQGAALGPGDLARVRPLGVLIAPWASSSLMPLLRAGGLVTHFQPIVSASGREAGRVFGYECLLRGVGDDGVLVGPSRLFEAARSADLLPCLDAEARAMAIRSAGLQGLGGDITLFVNLNPEAVEDPEPCFRAAEASVEDASLSPGRVVFEMVESDRGGGLGRASRLASACRDAGFRLALDDIGSGYNSLRLLEALRPDFLKLDIDLIRGVDRNPARATIARKVVEMARELGVFVVAEGVETPGEWDWVRAHDADYAQGFYFARPNSPPPTVDAARSGGHPAPAACTAD